ncbi:MAG TPA: copper chaperone PCu(A)C [Gemmatimonadales bacterium]|nr:copper chaperone PCu(A)C [Gemmatimonadales bacterium]
MRSLPRVTRHSATVLLLAIAGCGRGGGPPLAERNGLRIMSGYAHPSAGQAGAAYFTIVNRGGVPDTLSGASGATSGSGMVMSTSAGRMMSMAVLPIATGAEVKMVPGGTHIMFGGLGRDWAIGDTVHLTLHFAHAGAVEVTVPVLPYGEIP